MSHASGFMRVAVVLLLAAGIFVGGSYAFVVFQGKKADNTNVQSLSNYNVQSIPLKGLVDSGSLGLDTSQSLSINGQLRVNNSLVIAPSSKPANGTIGQVYYDKDGQYLAYYNGAKFVNIAGTDAVDALQAKLSALQASVAQLPTTSVTLPADLVTESRNNNFTGANSFGAGLSASNISTGSLDTTSLTASGATLLQGSLDVSGSTNLASTTISSLILSSPLGVASGGTGTNSLANNGIVIGQGTSAVATVTTATAGLCLMSTAGAPSFQACPGGFGAGVTAFDGLSGALTLSNSTGVGTTITIDDASTTGKGIASFNASNFSVSAGSVNTIQNISVSSSPTFAGLTLTSPLAVGSGGTGANTLTSNGVVIGQGSAALSTVTAPGAGYCLVSTAGAPTFQVCPGASGVSSVDGLNGALTIGDTTASGSTITINDASSTAKGIASFNASNFSVLGGTVNTIQNIGTTSSPLFNALTLANALSVTSGGTGTNTFATNGLLLGQGTSALTTVTAPGAGLCLVSTINAPTFQACPGTGGVSSLNGLSGVLNLNNASGSGSSITIDDATATTKGIASFNSTNFVVSSGAVNTIQNISTLSSPTFNALTLSNALNVASGGTGSASLTANGILVGQGTAAISAVTASGVGQCLVSTAGAPTFQACPGSGGVSSVNGLTGAIVLNNSSAAGSSITINDATTSTKGIASFNGTNFTVTAGAVNTAQNIDTAATPTFGGLTLNGNLNGQIISSSANFTGSLTVGTTLFANTITPSGAMTIGSTGQILTLQGNASTSLSATSGASTTTLTFQAPTANVTYRLQTAAAGTYDVCTTAGNCTSVGGGVTTAGGTAGKIAKFTGSQAIADSLLSESGSTVTVGGSLSVNTITPTAAMTVGSVGQSLILQGDSSTKVSATSGGITNSLLFALPAGSNKSITLPNASGTVAVSASGPIALDANGNISCPTCTTGGGGVGGAVDSLNGLNGALTLANATGAGSTITIDNASTTAKGIASFNSTNFTVTNGAVNTVQDISVSSSPTFNALTLSTALSVANGGTGSTTAAGARTNLGAAASGANSDITSLSGLTTALSISQGGTGSTTSQGAINNISQLTTAGDILYFDGTNSTRLARGTNGQCLTSNATTVVWGSCGISAETDTLATVTARGSLTTTAVQLQGGAAIRGLTVDTATSTDDRLVMAVATGGAARFDGTVTAADLTANRTWTLPNASGTVAVSASGPIVLDANGNISCPTCGISGSGVNSVNGLTGTLNISNATGAGTTITIDDASTTAKGIASFNSTNFSVVSGAVNTIQDIATTSSPTFNSLSLTTALSVANGGTGATTSSGARTNLGAAASGANSDITSLSGLTTALSIGQGGTGANTSQGAINNISQLTTAGDLLYYDGTNSTRLARGSSGQCLTSNTTTVVWGSCGLSAEADTLATVTARGSLTTTAVQLQGGASVRGLTVDTATSTDDRLIMAIATGGAARFDGTVTAADLTAARTWTLPNASGTIAVSASGPIVLDANGNISCPTCGVAGSGVTSLNGLTGALSVANASAAGSTITINDATTAAKGIASFNSTNFTVTAGAVNTVQDIATTSSPTFNALSLTTALSVANGGTGSTTAAGARTNLGAAASGANSDITSLSGLTTALSIGQGGTGATTSQGAINNVSQLTTAGDLLYYDGTNSTRLARGTNGQCLTSNTTTVVWGSCGLSAEADTLATVTARGSSTTTAVQLQGGAAVRGLTVDTATSTDDRLVMAIATGGAARFDGTVTAADLTANRTWTLPNASGTIAVSASGMISLDANGNITCPTCGAAGSGVTSLNGLTGALSVANASAAGSTITINDATAGTKGIASFNSTNFTVTAGAVNTVQDIATTSSPTFNALSLTTALSVANGGTGSTTAAGARTNLGAAASGANSDITSLSGLTTALSIGQGGTGATTSQGAINNISQLTTAGDLLYYDGTNSTRLARGTSGQCLTSNTTTVLWGSCGLTSEADTLATVTARGSLTTTAVQLQGGAAIRGLTVDTATSTDDRLIMAVATGGAARFDGTVTAADLTANRTWTLPNASGTIAVSASGPIVLDANGNISCPTCGVSGAGVNSVDGLTGSLTINNTSGAGTTITIDDASATAKGIASFNSTNFTVTAGAVNTVQNIATTSSPTFNALSLTTALSVANGGTGSTTAAGARTNLGAAASGANSDITSLSGLTTALSLGQGGTGATTSQGAINNISQLTTTGDLLYYDGTNSTRLARGTNGQCLMSNATTIAWSGCLTAEADTLATVTARGATTSTAVALQGGATVRGLTIDTATATDDKITLNVTAGGLGSFTGAITAADLTGNRTYTLPNASGTLAVSASGNIALSATGDITFTGVLPVANGGTGANTLTANGVIIGNGTSALSAVAAGGAGQCLVSTAGAPAFQACPGAGGVASLNSLTGALILANASGTGTTITIDDASTTAKGIASFNSTNFSVAAGAVNTVQNINSTATPTFGGLTLNGSLNGQTISSSANFTGSLTVGTTLYANTITPSGAMTIGSTGQILTLQGNASSTLSATAGASTTTLAFQSPTANVTYRLQTAAAGTYDVCTTVGNCAGVGGGVTTAGGTTGKIAKFTGSGSIGDSLLSESGSTVTVGGSLSVNTITPTAALTVGATGQTFILQGDASSKVSATSGGITNSLLFALPAGSNKSITLPNASGTVAVSASGPISLDANGNISCPTCTTSGGGTGGAVDSLNGLNGTLTIANASGVGSTITIDNASTTAKGIASFNSTNFTVTAGAVNTVQDISVSGSPTFNALTLTTALSVANGGTGSTTAAGARTNLGAAASGANSDITSLSGLTTALSVSQGGTGATTAAGARTNLGAAASGANSDITSLSGLTTALSINQGGTGATTSQAAINNISQLTTAGDLLYYDGTNSTRLARGTNGQCLTSNATTVVWGSCGLTAEADTLATVTARGSVTSTAVQLQGGASIRGLTVDTATSTDDRLIMAIATGGAARFDGTVTAADLTAARTWTLPNASGTIAVSASGPIVLDANGNISCPTCGISGSGVTSLNGLTGALSVANASAAGSTITINDATTAAKGIASFNSTNFTVTTGAVNTIQDIATTSSPTFNALTLSTALSVANGGTGATTAAGARTNLGAAASGANSDITSLSGLTTALSIGQGGTGAATSQGALNNISQLTTTGDLLYYNGTNSTRLARGSNGQCLTSNATTVVWGTCLSAEADTLATVTGRGSLTSTAVQLQGGAAIRGMTVDTATATDDRIIMAVATGGAARFDGTITAADLTANRTYTLPNASGTFAVSASGMISLDANGNITCPTCGVSGSGVTSLNGLTGALSVANASAAGSTVTINDATTAAKGIASFNSTNFTVTAGAVNTVQNIATTSSPTFNALSLTTALSVANGGTGATTAAGARTNLGAAASGANSDITSLSGLTTALSIAQGGTGATTSQGALNNISQLTTTGDLLYYDGTNSTRLARGASGQCLTSNTTTVVWGSCGLTSEADTLATVTARGSLTTTAVQLQGGAAIRGLTVDTATSTDDRLIMAVATGGAARFDGTVTASDLTAARTWTLPNASGTIAVSASGPIVLDANGNISCPTCGVSGSGVTSLNGLAGALSVANASAAGSTITINDATTAAKGIASFNSTNFTVTTGAVNTIQDIATTSSPTFNALSLTTALSIANGGTGATTASGARTNLGAAASGANSDITSLSGLTTALSIAQGGTGATTSQAAINNLSQLTTTGDLLYYNGTNSTRLARGSNGQCLTSNATTIAWGGCLTAEADTLATVTARGATTSTAVLLQGGATIRGMTVDTATAADDKIAVSVTTGGVASFTGTITSSDLTAARTWTLPDASGTFCLQNSTSCGFAPTTGGTGYIQNQNAAQQATSNFWISGTGRADTALQAPSFDTAVAGTLTIGGTNATGISLAQSTTLTAGKSLTVTGGITSTRPASPTEGMIYYDTTTKQLLVYSNGKWQADRSTSNKIVAMGTATGCTGSSPVASQNPDGADFVVTSCTSAQTTINSAIAALPAGGGTVYLMDGTYIVDGTINLPANVKLSGAGAGTVIKIKDATNASMNIITNTGNYGIEVRSMLLDGNSVNNTAGNQTGIGFSGSNSVTQTSAIIDSVTAQKFRTYGASLGSMPYSVVSNSMFYSNTSYGLSDGSDYGMVKGNTFMNNGAAGVVLGGTGMTVTANTAKSNTAEGIYINGTYIQVSGNTAASNSSTGIRANGGNASIMSNSVISNTGIGIYASSNYNTIGNNYVTGSGNTGIELGSVSYNSVNANTIMNSVGDGIYLNTPGGATANSITNNFITDNGGSTYAIELANTNCIRTFLSGNTYYGTGAATIRDGSNTTIYGAQMTTTAYLQSSSTILKAKTSGSLTGTAAISGTTSITGTGTTFTTELEIGDRVTINGETRTISAIASGTSATVSSAFTTTASGQTVTRLPAALLVRDSSGTNILTVDSTGALSSASTINAASGFMSNGTAGSTTTCSGGNVLQNMVVSGGIVTGGTCAAITTGVTTVGAIDGGVYSANGASISGTSIFLQTASATQVGLVNTVAQTFAGNKTIRGALGVDTATATDDKITLSVTTGGAASFTGNITAADLTAGRTYTLPDASGTFAVSASGNIALSAAGNIAFTGQLPIANGGTNATTAQGAINNLSGLTTNGDLLYNDGTNSTRLARGTNGQCLTSNATTILWGSCGITSEADTLATVTARGATTSTAVALQGGATIRGFTVDTATGTDDKLAMSVTTGGAASFTGTITAADLTAARTWTLPDATGTIISTGNLSSITATGALASGSIAAGFGTISTSNNITTTTTVQGGTVNATTSLQLNGADINTAGTLTNVAYENQANVFTLGNTFQSGLTVNTATATQDQIAVSAAAVGAARFTGTITNADLTAARTYTLPDASGTFAVSASGNIALSAAGNLTFTGQLPIANGGTNSTTAQGAINNLSGLTTAGDILYNDGTNSTRLARGTNGQCLTSNATTILWGSCGLTAEADTLATVTGRGASTTTAVVLQGGATTRGEVIDSATGTNDKIALSVTTVGAGSFTGTITNADLTAARTYTLPDATGTFITTGNLTSITATGALTSGSIASGFGAISTTNSIATTVAIQGATVNGTSAIQLNGTDINTAGTLTNVAYKNSANVFTLANTFQSTLTVNTATATQDQITVSAAAVGAARFTGTITNADLTANQTYTLPNETGTFCLQNSANCGFLTGSASSYIQNQNAAQQATSNYWISGTGRADTSLQVGSATTGMRLTSSSLSFGDGTGWTFDIKGGGASLISLVDNGNITLSKTTTINGSNNGLIVTNGTTSSSSVIVAKTGVGATGSILELQDSSANILSKFDANGQLTLGRITASGTTRAGTLTFADGTVDNFGATLNTTTLTANRTITLPDASGTICLQSSSSCGFATGTSASYIQNQSSSQQATSNFWISGTGRADTALQAPTFDTATAAVLTLGGNATSISVQDSVTLAAAKTLTVTGDITANRPAGTEGMIFYDTTTKQLLTYSNGKWQADSKGATVVVAAGGSSQTAKDSAQYVGDGTNDQNAINNAIAALPAGGGTVVLLEGTYNITGTISTTKSNIVITGQSQKNTILKRMYNDATVDVTGLFSIKHSYTTIENLMIDGNKASFASSNNVGILVCQQMKDFTVKSTIIDSSAASGIKGTWATMSGCSPTASGTWQIEDNEITNNTGSGIDASNASDQVTVHASGNIISGNGAAGIGATNKSIIESNAISSNSTGVSLSWGDGAVVTDNTITSQTTDGISVQSNANNATVSGNTIRSTTGTAIKAWGSNATVSANNISSNGVGIDIRNNYSVFSANTISSNTGSGIVFSGGSNTKNTITGNSFYDNGGSGAVSTISLQNSVSSIVTDNTIVDTAGTGYAIDVASTTGVYLSGNIFSGTGATTIGGSAADTTFANQLDSNGNTINRTLGGAFTVGTAAPASTFTLQGGMSTIQLSAPAAPTIANVGTAGTTSYSYTVTAVDGMGETVQSTAGSTTTGNANIDGTNYNTITWTKVSGAVSYKIYRSATASTFDTTTGLIGTVTTSGTSTTQTFNDTGLVASGSAPTSNNTGSLGVAGFIQGAGSLQAYNFSGSNYVLTVQANSGRGTNSNVVVVGTDGGANRAAFYVSGAGAPNTFEAGGTSGWSSKITTAATNVGLVVQGASSQSSNLLELQNSSGGVLSRINANGDLLVGGTSAASSTSAFQVQDTAGASLLSADTTNLRVTVGSMGTAQGQLYVGGYINSTPASTLATSFSTNSMKGITVDGYTYAYNTTTPAITIFDTSDPLHMTQVGQISATGAPSKLVASRGFLYTSNMRIYNVKDPVNPTSVGSFGTSCTSRSLAVSGNYLYVICSSQSTLQIYDISNQSSPKLTGSVNLGTTGAQDVVVQGSYAYLVANSTYSLIVVNVANPASPTVSGTLLTSPNQQMFSVAVQGHYVYAKNGNDGISTYVFDVSNPASPTKAASIGATNNSNSSAFDNAQLIPAGNLLFNGGKGGTIDVYDITNPASITRPTTLAGGVLVGMQGRYLLTIDTTTGSLKSYDIGGGYLQQVQSGSLQTSALQVTNDATVTGQLTVRGGIQGGTINANSVAGDTLVAAQAVITPVIRPVTDSTTALQVQNTAGTTLLNFDTSNSNVAITAGTTDAVLGTSTINTSSGPINGFTPAGTNWTSTNWTFADANHATHVTGNTSTLTSNWTPTVGVTYFMQYAFTCNGYVGTNALNVTLGGSTIPVSGCDSGSPGWTSATVTATTTGALVFTPASTFTGTIYNVTVTPVTSTVASVLTVKNSSSVATLDVRSSGDATNVFIGLGSGTYNASGSNYNTAVGSYSQQQSIYGFNNSSFGTKSLNANVQGWDNSAFGMMALTNNVTGYENTAIGSTSMKLNTTGYDNAAVGLASLYSNITGSYNATQGGYSLYANTTGNQNTALGYNAGGNNTTGSNNLSLGYNAGYQDSAGYSSLNTLSNLQNATAIGAFAQVQQSNSIVLGSIDTTTKVGIGTTIPDSLFSVSPVVYNAGTAGTGGVSSTTVTGSSTAWQTSGLVKVGMKIIFADGQSATINSINSDTSLTLASAVNEAAGKKYRIHTTGLQVTTVGDTYIQKTSTTAFAVKDQGATNLLNIDSSGLAVTIGSTTTDANAVELTLDSYNNATDPTGVAGAMYYNSSKSKFRCFENNAWKDCISGFNTITKTADQAATQSSTVMQNDNTLSFAMAASTNYVFDAWIPIDDSNATATGKYTFTIPAGAVLNLSTQNYSGAATTTTICNVVASAQVCVLSSSSAVNFIQVRGFVRNSTTAGNLQFQFAQNTSTAASFPVVKSGATLSWHTTN